VEFSGAVLRIPDVSLPSYRRKGILKIINIDPCATATRWEAGSFADA
jgi:hypothetical protein